MRVLLSSLLLGLAWFAAINLVLSAVVWLAARGSASGAHHPSPAGLLRLRLGPAAISTFFVVLMFLPAHWRLEPFEVEESFGLAVFLLALLGAAVIARVVRRAAALGLAEWRLNRLLRSGAEVTPGVFELQAFIGMALAGVVRPRIVIGTRTRTALSEEEIVVAIAHERAHLRSRDNLKRCAMFCAPDFLGWTAAAERLETRWRAEAECRADLEAAAGDASRAVHLAAALVKVSRLIPTLPASTGSPVWSSFHDAPLLERRVRSLLEDSRYGSSGTTDRTRSWICVLLAAAAGGWLLGVPAQIHQLTETAIRFLP